MPGRFPHMSRPAPNIGTHLLWLLLLLLPISYFIQEMVVRLGIATGQGHAAMIYQRFGKWWGRFSLVDLLLLNFLTLVTEFAAIALALRQHGRIPCLGVPVAAAALACFGADRKLSAVGADRGFSLPARPGMVRDCILRASGCRRGAA